MASCLSLVVLIQSVLCIKNAACTLYTVQCTGGQLGQSVQYETNYVTTASQGQPQDTWAAWRIGFLF